MHGESWRNGEPSCPWSQWNSRLCLPEKCQLLLMLRGGQTPIRQQLRGVGDSILGGGCWVSLSVLSFYQSDAPFPRKTPVCAG